MSVRARSMRALHVGVKQLGWDDERYRSYLEQLTGKRSAADLTDFEIARVLDSMRTLGFRRAPGAPEPKPAATTQLDKARELWRELEELGELRAPGEQGFHSYVERMTKRSSPTWCTPEQLSKVIEGLKAWRDRAQRRVITEPVEPQ